jgi:t-SNARE complex subunit (syntaxin)
MATVITINSKCVEISNLLDEIKNIVDPLKIHLSTEGTNTTNFAFEPISKDVVSSHIKNITANMKKIKTDLIDLKRIISTGNESIKTMFDAKIKVLNKKYTTTLKNVLLLTSNYKQSENISYEPAIEINPPELKTVQMASNIVIDAYRETSARASEITMLANDVREINDMFKDFAVLIDAQHEEIIDVHDNIEDTSHKISESNKKIRDAIKNQKLIRKRWCCLIIIIITLIIIVVAVSGGITKFQ